MAERTVAGVDFSGGKDDRNTWVAQGALTEGGRIRFDRVLPMRREDLFRFLTTVAPPAVAAIDFPFGLPEEVIKSIHFKATDMRQVWDKISAMNLEHLMNVGGNLKRTSDNRFPGSLAPLNVRIAGMTYTGMKLLYQLHADYPGRWYVPPLELAGKESDKVTLLEVMPGAVLERVGFTRAVAKGYKNAKNAFANRDLIIRDLSEKSQIEFDNFEEIRLGCRANDDCLDSVIALVAAALWTRSQSQFDCPDDNDELAKLEGWIYAPKK